MCVFLLMCGGGCVAPAAAAAGTQRKLAGQAGWLSQYERAVQVSPAYAPAHYNLGEWVERWHSLTAH